MASILRSDLLNSLADAEIETAIAAVQSKYQTQWEAIDGTPSATIDVQFANQFRKEVLKVLTRRLARKDRRNRTYGPADAGRV